MNRVDIAVLSFGCTLLGVLISKIWQVAVKSTTMEGKVEKNKKDVDGLGRKQRAMMAEQIILAQGESKQDFAVLVRKLINGI